MSRYLAALYVALIAGILASSAEAAVYSLQFSSSTANVLPGGSLTVEVRLYATGSPNEVDDEGGLIQADVDITQDVTSDFISTLSTSGMGLFDSLSVTGLPSAVDATLLSDLGVTFGSSPFIELFDLNILVPLTATPGQTASMTLQVAPELDEGLFTQASEITASSGSLVLTVIPEPGCLALIALAGMVALSGRRH